MRWITPPRSCPYLPDQAQVLHYILAPDLTPEIYLRAMMQGWRRFGMNIFRPACPACTACRSLRLDPSRFRPDRSQRRVRAKNAGEIELSIGPPDPTPEVLDLFDRFHAYQADALDWPRHQAKDLAGFRESFVDNPFPTSEYRYRLGGELVCVCYVDILPEGHSAIYCFHDPAHRDRSLGTWNILSIIERAAGDDVPYVYLGYYVAGCRSLEYKRRFRPNQILGPDGWSDFDL